MNIALIIAGGSGARMNQDIPKQFLTVNEKPVIIYTLEQFQKHPQIDKIAIVCIKGWESVLHAYAKQFNITKLTSVVTGGENVSAEIISDCIRAANENGNAITVIPCAEAMLQTKDGASSTESFPRDDLKRTQTPQAFRLGEICQVHRDALEKGIVNSVASCTLYIEMGRKVYFSKGSEKNIKLTTVDDIDIFKALLSTKRSDWLR